MASWPTQLVFKRAIERGCTTLPGREESHPKLQTCWEGPYLIITWISNVIYRIQQHPTAKMMIIHLERLAPYLGATQGE
jgi:hypothetical protein